MTQIAAVGIAESLSCPLTDILSLFAPAPEVPSLETILCDVAYFGLTTASPLQRAICRVLDGVSLGVLDADASVIRAFGGLEAVELYERAPFTPKELVLLAGIRSGKSLLAAAAIVRAALACDMSRILPGEPMPRASILSTSRETAQPTWDHIYGHVMRSAALKALLVGEPKQNSLTLRHHSGRPVEIVVVAGSRAASTLVARWSAGVIFDEAPRLVGEEDGVVNLDHARASIAGRMLPGAPTIMSGSPWGPFGPVYDLVDKKWGQPSPALVVIRARGPDMNPITWTPEACAALKAAKPDAYRVDVECEFLDPESGLVALSELEQCVRREGPQVTPAKPGHYYVAAMDPATRGNSWSLVLVEHARNLALNDYTGPGMRVALATQWTGSTSKPLSPTETFREIAALLAPYNITTLHTDEWAADSLIELAAAQGLWLTSHRTTDKLKLTMMTELAARIADRTIELPPNRDLLRDIASVRKKTTATGVSIHLPLQGSGRHCDFAPALALALQHTPLPPEPVAVLTARAAEPVLAPEKETARREVADKLKNRAKNLRWGR